MARSEPFCVPPHPISLQPQPIRAPIHASQSNNHEHYQSFGELRALIGNNTVIIRQTRRFSSFQGLQKDTAVIEITKKRVRTTKNSEQFRNMQKKSERDDQVTVIVLE